MTQDIFGLSDGQFKRIKLHIPADTRGKARVDDRRVISGIIHDDKVGSTATHRTHVLPSQGLQTHYNTI